jgi:hypothetical protein
MLRHRRSARLAALLSALVLLVGLGVAGGLRRARYQLAVHQAEIDDLRAGSIASNRAAEDLLASGRYELEVLFSTKLLTLAAHELVGYRQLTRKGNRFTINELALTVHDGWLELVAHADFDWRWGLYDGPIEVRYVAFAAIDDDGGCSLHFRVAEVKTLAQASFLRRWLGPILTLRMQNHLKLPDFQLPLAVGGKRDLDAKARGSSPRQRPWRIRYAPRGWQLGAQNPQLLLNGDAFGLVVEHVDPLLPNAIAVAVAREGQRLTTSPLGADDVVIGMRFDRLSALLSQLFAPPDEVSIEIARLPIPLERHTSHLVGVEFARSLTLRDVVGAIDVRLAALRLAGDHVDVGASFEGRFAGIVEGSSYGVDFAVPVRVRPRLDEVVPLHFLDQQGDLGIFPEASSATIHLAVEAAVGGRQIAFDYPLELESSELVRPLLLRDMTSREVAVPTVVERGKIIASRPLDLAIHWSFELPTTPEDFVRIAGEVGLGEAGTGAAHEAVDPGDRLP